MTETQTSPFIIAVDGPAGSGKSSVSRAVARARGFGYLDTGAVYRALAWSVLDRGEDTGDADAVLRAAADFAPRIGLDPDDRSVHVGEREITAEIREPRVSGAVSGVARVPEVREMVNALFRRLVADASQPAVVVEGRDITTVVAPDAPVRILLTADPAVRAARRARELGAEDDASVAEAIQRRDTADSAVVDFLTAAPGVEVVDSTALDLPQTIDAVISVIERRRGAHHG